MMVGPEVAALIAERLSEMFVFVRLQNIYRTIARCLYVESFVLLRPINMPARFVLKCSTFCKHGVIMCFLWM